MRLRSPIALFIQRPTYLLLLVPVGILIHLLVGTSSGNHQGFGRQQVLDEQARYAYEYQHESTRYANDFGSDDGFINRISKLTDKVRGKTSPGNAGSGQRTQSSSSKRSAGSLYELVTSSPTSLYDARTSLDKIRLTSTRFVNGKPPSPTAVFSQIQERQHILVTGGFSSIGLSLVRDLLLLGDDSGAALAAEQSRRTGLFTQEQQGADKAGLVVTLVDTDDRSEELDELLRHLPLYHRSRVGFNLPSSGNGLPYAHHSLNNNDQQQNAGLDGTPPLEIVDPRSAAFSKSQISLASYIEKGRLRIIKSDARNITLLAHLLNPRLYPAHPGAQSSGKQENEAVTEDSLSKLSKTRNRFANLKKPHQSSANDESLNFPPISGIYYLAGYERSDCEILNKRDCIDLERNGVNALVKAMEGTDPEDRPWIVLADRGNLDTEVAGDILSTTFQASVSADSRLDKMNQAQNAPHMPQKRSYSFKTSTYIQPLLNFAETQKFHAISLRLPPDSHLYGDIFASRLLPIPHLVHSAIGHLPISVDSDNFPAMSVSRSGTVHDDPSQTFNSTSSQKDIWSNTGLLYVEDLVETLLAAGELLAKSNSAEYFKRVSILSEIDVVPSALSASRQHTSSQSLAKDAIDWIIQLTKSSSPVGYLSATQQPLSPSSIPSGHPLDHGISQRILGTSPRTPLVLGLKAYIHGLLSRQNDYLVDKMNTACASPPDPRTLNDGLAQLDKCSVQILGMIWSENVVLSCNPAYKPGALTEEGNKNVSPIILGNAVPDQGESISQVKLKSKWGPVGRVDFGLFCPFGDDGADEQIVWLENTERQERGWTTSTEAATLSSQDPSSTWIFDSFEVNFVRRDQRSYTLSISQYPQANAENPKRRMVYLYDHSKRASGTSGVKDAVDFEFQLLADTVEGWQTMEWRINPVVCQGKEFKEVNGFSFLREDPLYTSQILYPSGDGTTSIAESTYEASRCRDFRSAHEYLNKLSTWNDKTLIGATCPRQMGEGTDWNIQELSACTVDCEAPISCLVTDNCRCARDRCGDIGKVASTDQVALTQKLSFDYKNLSRSDWMPAVSAEESERSLQVKVNAFSWDYVIQPTARHLITLSLSQLPKGHVVSFPPDIDTHLSNPACHILDPDNETSTYIADHFLITALQERNAEMGDADFAVIPFFQGCYEAVLKENTYHKLAIAVQNAEMQLLITDKLKASNIVVPFTHDWGSCTGFWTRHEEVLARTPPPPMSKAISWQTNGDLSTHCLKPERDVIIPPVTRHNQALRAAYADLAKVTPSSQRTQLAFFNGKLEGLGSFARTRLAAVDGMVYEASSEKEDYIQQLGKSKFCLLPRGISGWSPHIVDAIYSGCIPVFIADRTAQPFNGIFAYHTFSLSIAENAIHTLPSILARYTAADIDRMQIALMKVREAFMYSNDPKQEWARRGPLYYTLLEMAQKVSLDWPTTSIHSTCSSNSQM